MKEPEILTKFIEMEGKPLFPSILKIKRDERIATYDLRNIQDSNHTAPKETS